MPLVVDYSLVLATLEADGHRCLYHNSGAFGFGPEDRVAYVGWIGRPDSTIRPAGRPFVRQFPQPFAEHLAIATTTAWHKFLSGNVWVMPKSHWSYELEFGNSAWLPQTLVDAGIEPDLLTPRNNGSALEFPIDESEPFRLFIQSLLENLQGSDFTLAFPGRGVIGTLHHHQQVWWQSRNPGLIDDLRTSVK